MEVEQSLTQSLYKVNLPGMALRLILTVERDHLLPSSSFIQCTNRLEWVLIEISGGVHADTCKPVCTVTR